MWTSHTLSPGCVCQQVMLCLGRAYKQKKQEMEASVFSMCCIHPRSVKPLRDCPLRQIQLKTNVEKLIGISGLWINGAVHLGIVSSEEGQFTVDHHSLASGSSSASVK